MFSKALNTKVEKLLLLASEKNVALSTAESCTGGLVASLLTDVSGSSTSFICSHVTYSNDSKIVLLGVLDSLLCTHGAVSEQVANAMSLGMVGKLSTILDNTPSAIFDVALSVAITGVAGPVGGSAEKPVGTVYLSTSILPLGQNEAIKTVCQKHLFSGNRKNVRLSSVEVAIDMLFEAIKEIDNKKNDDE